MDKENSYSATLLINKMYRPRVIPTLLLRNLGLVKTVRFKDHRYIGDPINAVKLFNDLKADELVFLDILAGKEKRTVSLNFVERVGDEANMPIAVGGGIRSLRDIRNILKAGAEKVVINSYAGENPDFIKSASNEFGSSTIVVCIDFRRKLFGKPTVYINNGTTPLSYNPVDFARIMEKNGAGEIIINSINHDGMMDGYDIDVLREISDKITVPIVALGGAGNISDLRKAIKEGHASATAAGSLFIYHGPRKAVLINYPTQEELIDLFV